MLCPASPCPSPLAAPTPGSASRPRRNPGRISRDDRHFLVLPGLAVAFARVPKAANSTIRYRLAADLGLKGDGHRPSNDAFWLNQPSDMARSLTRLQFARLADDVRPWCFTVVRHPVARLWSAWNNKVIENDSLSARFTAMGVVHGMPFDTFAERVAATPDADCDIHVRTQWSILAIGDRLLPDQVARVEALETDWETIRATVEARSGRKLGNLQARNVRANATADVSQRISPSTLALIRDRFARDFAAFYPDG
jgi:dermatan 4-sulfotransferase 1